VLSVRKSMKKGATKGAAVRGCGLFQALGGT